MIGRLDYVAITVPDLEVAAKTCKETLGVNVSARWLNSSARAS